MALIVEDGSIVAGANSYIDDALFVAFCDSRGIAYPATAAEREPLIIKAKDYIESFRAKFAGMKVQAGQPLQWPRDGVYIDGFAVGADEIPVDLQYAQAQAAVEINAGSDLQENTGRNIKREKVDVIEVEYQDGDGALTTPTFPKVDAYLDALLASGGSINTIVQAVR